MRNHLAFALKILIAATELVSGLTPPLGISNYPLSCRNACPGSVNRWPRHRPDPTGRATL